MCGAKCYTTLVEFTVSGNPRPKGSMRFGVSKHTGRVVPIGPRRTRKDGSKIPDYLKIWTKEIQLIAAHSMDGAPYDGFVRVSAQFRYARPKDHYCTGRKSATLRPDAPMYPASRYFADLDKLLRALLDAMTGIVWVDDSQVVEFGNVSKIFGDPGATVKVET